MKIVDRKEIYIDAYVEILEKETHHSHIIIEDKNGTYRWKEDKSIRQLVDLIGLNCIVEKLYAEGFTKNSEEYRKLYRDLGYSLSGYWEVFYWVVNNEDAENYRK